MLESRTLEAHAAGWVEGGEQRALIEGHQMREEQPPVFPFEAHHLEALVEDGHGLEGADVKESASSLAQRGQLAERADQLSPELEADFGRRATLGVNRSDLLVVEVEYPDCVAA